MGATELVYTSATPEFIEVNGHTVMAYRYGPLKLLHVSGAPPRASGYERSLSPLESVECVIEGGLIRPAETHREWKPIPVKLGRRIAIGLARFVSSKNQGSIWYVLYECSGYAEHRVECGDQAYMSAHKWRQRCGQASYRQSGCEKCKGVLASRHNRLKGPIKKAHPNQNTLAMSERSRSFGR